MPDRISHIFKTIETMNEDDFTESELDLLMSFERQFHQFGRLSTRQVEVLENIYRKAGAR